MRPTEDSLLEFMSLKARKPDQDQPCLALRGGGGGDPPSVPSPPGQLLSVGLLLFTTTIPWMIGSGAGNRCKTTRLFASASGITDPNNKNACFTFLRVFRSAQVGPPQTAQYLMR
ncbi:hypothetical protein R1flu_020002 [Riccia fluitans]|uniref:Uncharacterized protein n=1 Tax=Riccia fluitans TaxID=41844 RepID=A0ABD1ZP33_9MARC